MGSIYVVGANGERFDATGGPSFGYQDHGGHTAESTPAGHYTLGPKIHVSTASWPMSVIRWGAALRLNQSSEVEFSDDGRKWRLATGLLGEVTQAEIAYLNRDGKLHLVSKQRIVDHVRAIFVDPLSDKLRSPIWEKNDFGRWGWNMLAKGKGTGFYVHTTPADEAATAAAKAVFLTNSHGCIHLAPADRDLMIARGYLAPGVDLEVRSYGEKGPP